MISVTNRLRPVLFGVLALGLIVGLACSDEASPAAHTGEAAATSAPVVAQPTEAPVLTQATPPVQDPGAEPSADLAFSHVQKLAGEIGVRTSGSPQEHASAEYIAQLLRGYGYEVEMQRFPVEQFISRSVSLRLESGDQRAIQAEPFTMSRPGAAGGEVVYAGLGRPEDFPSRTRGRIALIQRGEIPFREKAVNAAAAGATAVIIFNTEPELLVGTLTQDGPDIPAIAISGDDGRRLRDEVAAGNMRAALNFDGGLVRSESINIIGRPPGARCRVVLGGHYDSVPGAPGASDNATGTAATIEMARVTALRGNPEQACFVAFGSEETGLNGSRVFVQRMTPEDRNTLRFMLNFDMVAVGTDWILIGSRALQDQGQAITSDLGIAARPSRLPASTSSDHASFIDAGIQSLMLHRSDDPLLHTPRDVVDRVSKDQLGEAVRIGLALLTGINPT